MALKKTFTTDFGVSGDYWKISEIRMGRGNKDMFKLVLYKSATARSNGLDPLPVEISYVFPRTIINDGVESRQQTPFTVENMASQNVWEAAYNFAKEQEEFEGSIDV